jgi:hypothetical protein
MAGVIRYLPQHNKFIEYLLNRIAMKKNPKALFCILLIITFSFSSVNQLLGQKKVDISAGIGVPELLNIGMRLQLDQIQIGFSIGSFPSEDRSYSAITGDFYYHFAGHSKLSNRWAWYGRGGITYQRRELVKPKPVYPYPPLTWSAEELYLYLRLGRDINFSPTTGINIDVGASFSLFYEYIGHKGSFHFPVLPSLGATFFIRI